MTGCAGCVLEPRAAPPGTKAALIVNADDFGQSVGVNQGVTRAHEQGVVTSASLMVRWLAAAEAAAYARAHPRLSLGLHVDFGEWAYRDDNWVPLHGVIPTDDAQVACDEVARQLDAFRHLTGDDPTHLDSHQHVHRAEPLRSVLSELAETLSVPLRHCNSPARYSGAFYGQTRHGFPVPEAITVEALLQIIETLPPGITELGCHPGEIDSLDTMYRTERAVEVRTLCDPQVRARIAATGVRLCSFHECASMRRLRPPVR